jgi:hypothetical protein
MIICQVPRHKFSGEKLHAKVSSQNPLAYPINNSDTEDGIHYSHRRANLRSFTLYIITKVQNGPRSILTNELLQVGYSVGRCGADGSTCVLVFVGACPTGLTPNMAFKHPCTAHAFFPKHLSAYRQGIRRIFFEI